MSSVDSSESTAVRPAQLRAEQSPVPPLDPRDRLIVALDLPTAGEALAMVDRLQTSCRWFKVGLELFYAAGADLVQEMRRRHLNVFLDLKLHDIPNTVAAAVRSLSRLDAQLLTVHASGGTEMLAAAQQAARDSGNLSLVGVTVLTSMDTSQLREIGLAHDPAAQVLRLAHLTNKAGLAGVVCSPLEVASVRAALGLHSRLIVPGVRPLAAAADDQKRVATPADAIKAGASQLVVGRPITRAGNPTQAAAAILEEIRQATS